MKKANRMVFLAAVDGISIYAAGLLGSTIILNGGFSLEYITVWTKLALLILPMQIMLNYYVGLYSKVWTYASIGELVSVLKASTLGSGALFVVLRFNPNLGMGSLRTSTLYWLLATAVIGALRFAMRIRREIVVDASAKGVRALIVGAGDAGHMLLREIQKHPELKIKAVVLVDDEPSKQGMSICNVPVVGPLADLEIAIDEHDIKQVILAMPTAKPEVVRRVVQSCTKLGVDVRTMPGLYEVINGYYTPTRLREVQIEDLLRREVTKVDFAAIGSYITGKRVLVTGAGGSIGSELCRQIMGCGPAEIILLGHGENSIFNIHRELLGKAGGIAVVPIIADVQSPQRMKGVFGKHRPQVVFHAAAHKHVPLMESNAVEAIKNNVWGTSNVAEAASEYGVERFVLISSDKAVNPTNVMGATKRAAEMVIQKISLGSGTKFMAVRFGNVLGSRGSVVPIFKEQIAEGGPVTVTHPDMERYFMTIPEAVSLVLQAGSMGQGGEVFVLDMGSPVKITDMVRDLIALSGLRPDVDIKIVYTGIRPGEKMYEELLTAEEGTAATKHKKILVAKQAAVVVEAVNEMLASLSQMVHGDCANNAEVIKLTQLALQSKSFEQVAAAETQ
ncbi:MAG: putative nucleoside-diphosphate sugar epimerase [Bacillota bacterium]|nr:MAG: putative nucleoside-diphosphate sugar epimerase [Bacillota bacterium]MBS3950718.1 polysaccharide biosynthesis protein [Peptococcaceae bacterium]